MAVRIGPRIYTLQGWRPGDLRVGIPGLARGPQNSPSRQKRIPENDQMRPGNLPESSLRPGLRRNSATTPSVHPLSPQRAYAWPASWAGHVFERIKEVLRVIVQRNPPTCPQLSSNPPRFPERERQWKSGSVSGNDFEAGNGCLPLPGYHRFPGVEEHPAEVRRAVRKYHAQSQQKKYIWNVNSANPPRRSSGNVGAGNDG